MKRRGFLGLLLALPFAPALAEAAAQKISTDQWLINWKPRPTLLDVVNRYKDDGQILSVVEALSQKNPLLQDMVWQEKNIQLGHKISWGSRGK